MYARPVVAASVVGFVSFQPQRKRGGAEEGRNTFKGDVIRNMSSGKRRSHAVFCVPTTMIQRYHSISNLETVNFGSYSCFIISIRTSKHPSFHFMSRERKTVPCTKPAKSFPAFRCSGFFSSPCIAFATSSSAPFQSMGFAPATTIRTITSPSFGVGMDVSSIVVWREGAIIASFIVVVILVLVSELVWERECLSLDGMVSEFLSEGYR